MSNQAALEQLATTLKTNSTEISALASLSTPQIQQLNTWIEQARHKQRQALNEAIEEGLSYVPALLRGAVKAIVRG